MTKGVLAIFILAVLLFKVGLVATGAMLGIFMVAGLVLNALG